jgi:hypothetical protein
MRRHLVAAGLQETTQDAPVDTDFGLPDIPDNLANLGMG